MSRRCARCAKQRPGKEERRELIAEARAAGLAFKIDSTLLCPKCDAQVRGLLKTVARQAAKREVT